MALRRHDLVRPGSAAWDLLLAGAQDAGLSDCLAHWRREGLPLVVRRQERPQALALGLPAPLAWGRRKLALQLPHAAVSPASGFPRAADIGCLHLHPAGRELVAALAALGVDARVHGSHGWEQLTGLPYVTPRSDLDLLLPVHSPAQADAVGERLEAFRWPGPRLDGELLWPDGSGVAWREWLSWRRGAADRILVKRLHGVALEGTGWLPGAAGAAA